MYIMASRKGKQGRWSIARAREQVAELIRLAAREPQPIYNRDRPVGVVVDPQSYVEFMRFKQQQAQRSVGAAFEELRALGEEEGYSLDLGGVRVDRPNPLAEREG